MGDPVPSSAISDATTGGLSVIVITGGATGDVLTKQADGTYAAATPASGGITGSVGSTDNRLVRSDGTGGSTVQPTGITVDDSNNVSGVGTITCGAITASGIVRAGSQTGDYTAVEYFGSTYKTSVLSGYGLTHYADVHSFRGASGAAGVVRFVGMDVYLGAINTTGSDIGFIRSSATVLDIRSNGGTRFRNFANSADAPITCEAITASGLLCCGVYTFATVPSASSNTGKFLRISDRSQKHAYSDGTNWRFFGDDAVIS